MKNILLASTSTLFGQTYFEYLLPELELLYQNVDEVLFIPFARPGGISHDEYTSKVEEAFGKINKKVVGLHTFDNKKEAIQNAEAFFTGGGNTFVLVNNLYKYDVVSVLKNEIIKGKPYLGASAGTNIAGLTIGTTNDMPVVYPPSFQTLGLVPFNINPHYLDPVEGSVHMGETRETRIKEFHVYNTQPVVGLREGSWLRVIDETVVLKGVFSARIFEGGKEPYELDTNSNLNWLK